MKAVGARRWQRFRDYEGRKKRLRDDEQASDDGHQLLEGYRQEFCESLQYDASDSERRRASQYSGEIALTKYDEFQATEHWVSGNGRYPASINMSKGERLSYDPYSPTADGAHKGWSSVDDQVSSVPSSGSWRYGFKKMLRKQFMPFNLIEPAKILQRNHREVPEHCHMLSKNLVQLREMDANIQDNIHKSAFLRKKERNLEASASQVDIHLSMVTAEAGCRKRICIDQRKREANFFPRSNSLQKFFRRNKHEKQQLLLTDKEDVHYCEQAGYS